MARMDVRWSRRMAAGVIAAAGLVPPTGAAAASVRVAKRSVLPVPGGVCGVPADPSTPTFAAAGGRRVSVYTLLHGGDAAAEARSENRGATFAADAVEGATACSGGPSSHAFLVNPRAAMGPDGTAWFASSWGGNDGAVFSYGVEAIRSSGEVTRPEGSAQDLTILPDRSGPKARLLWTQFDQVPNPATYAPPATRLRTARVTESGSVSDETTALEPPPGRLLDDSALVRAKGALVAIASEASVADLVSTINPVTADEPVRFAGVSARSLDGGRTWEPGGAAGAPQLFSVPRDGYELMVGLSDVDRGPRGRIVRVYSVEPENGTGRIMATFSDDAGATWSESRPLVTAPVVAAQPAVALLGRNRLALTWYDGRGDTPGDGRFDLQPQAAVIDLADGARRQVPLGAAFDVGPIISPGYPVDGSGLGVTQDVTRTRGGFAAVHTEPDPDPGMTTQVVFTRLRVGR